MSNLFGRGTVWHQSIWAHGFKPQSNSIFKMVSLSKRVKNITMMCFHSLLVLYSSTVRRWICYYLHRFWDLSLRFLPPAQNNSNYIWKTSTATSLSRNNFSVHQDNPQTSLPTVSTGTTFCCRNSPNENRWPWVRDTVSRKRCNLVDLTFQSYLSWYHRAAALDNNSAHMGAEHWFNMSSLFAGGIFPPLSQWSQM